MANQREILKIVDFSGGLNNNASSTNIKENEAAKLTNLKTDKSGSLLSIKDAEKAASIYDNLPTYNGSGGQSSLAGRGIFGHGSDYSLADNESVGVPNSQEYLVYHPIPKFYSIDIHSKVEKDWYRGKMQFKSADGTIPQTGSMVPSYYIHNGMVRACDSDFSHDIVPRYHGYISKKFFLDGDKVAYQTLGKWQSGDAKIQSLTELGCKVQWVDTSTTNPVNDTLGQPGTITLGIKSVDNVGSWNGQYKVGVSAVYFGQEGEITEALETTDAGVASTDKYMYLNMASIQVELYLTVGSTANGINDAHILKDDRIDALRVYVQREADENWYMLFETNLETGHKATNWLHNYNSGTDTAKGVISTGNITISSFGSAAGSAEHNHSVLIDFGTNETTMDGEVYKLMVQGFYQTPMFVTFEKGLTQTQVVTLPVTNPINNTDANIDTMFKYTLQNQTNMPMMVKSIEKTITNNDDKPTDYNINTPVIVDKWADYETAASSQGDL